MLFDHQPCRQKLSFMFGIDVDAMFPQQPRGETDAVDATLLKTAVIYLWATAGRAAIGQQRKTAMMRQRGMRWSELGLSPRHWKRGTIYSVGAVGLVLAGAVLVLVYFLAT